MRGTIGRGRKQLEVGRAGPERHERFARRAEAGKRDEAALHRARDHRRVGVGRNDDAAAGAGHRVHRCGSEHRAGAMDHPPLEGAQAGDAFQRIGGIQGDFHHPHAAGMQRLGYIQHLVRGHAADDGDDGGLGKRVFQFHRAIPLS